MLGRPSPRFALNAKRSAAGKLRAALALDAPQKPSASAALPAAALKNNVVVLEAPNASGGTTKVYVIGISHVSKLQAQQVKELIRAVRPEVVMVELCKDRVGLLVDDRLETQSTNMWHCRKVSIEGLPADPNWPAAAELKKLLVTRAGRPLTMQDIESDVVTLQATGLFKSVRPGAATANMDEAPEFGVAFGEDGSALLETVPPLGGVKFTVQERELPPITRFSVRVDSSLKDAGVDEASLAAVGTEAMTAVKEGTVTLLALLKAKQRFAEVVGRPVTVAFNGCESGRVEAIVKATKASDRPYVSGFESSAVNGEGWGIEPFRPIRPLHKLGNKMFLTNETLEAMRAEVKGAKAAAASASGQPSTSDMQPRSEFRVWSDEELAAAKRQDPERVPLADSFRAAMTLLYAKYQAEVGRKLGVERGAAWQAALQAATEVGAQQVVLSDRPSIITERRLADSILDAAGSRIGGAVGLILSTIVATLVMDAPLQTEAGAVGASILMAVGLLWPVVQPFVEIKRLSAMSPEEIEEAVSVKEALAGGASGKLFGEDALLDWPGAGTSLLEERDEFMARAAANVATGSDQGLCPAYVLDRVDGQVVWRLMHAEGAPAETCPPGFSDGVYKPLKDVRNVVKVVGTVHVQGMMQRWSQALQAPTDVAELIKYTVAAAPSSDVRSGSDAVSSATDVPSSSS